MKMRPSLFGAAMALALVGCSDKTPWLEGEWAKVEARARMEGVALTPADALQNEKTISDDENGAIGVKRALDLWFYDPAQAQSQDFQQNIKPEYASADLSIRNEMREAFIEGRQPNYSVLAKAIATLKPGLDVVEAAVKKPGWDFKRDWSRNLIAPPPLAEFNRFRLISRWFHAQALVAAHGGNTKQALGSIETIFRLARHLTSEPSASAIIGSSGCYLFGCQAVLNVARIRPNDTVLLNSLRALVHSSATLGKLRQVWRLENARRVAALDLFASDRGLSVFGSRSSAFVKRSRAEFLDTKIKIVSQLIQAKEQWNASSNDLTAMRDVAQRYEGPMGKIYLDYSSFYSLGDGLLQQAADVGPANEARRRLTWLSLTVLKNKAQGKEWGLPAEAADKAWFDPFVPQPMHFAKEGKGFVLYSVGKNKVDDGGVDARYPGDVSPDIVVTYPFRRNPNTTVPMKLQ